MTTVQKYTSTGAAGLEIHSRAERYIAEHKGASYHEAWNVVLQNDRQLAQSYAQPSPRRVRMAKIDPRSKPVIPIDKSDEREIREWILRALQDNMEGMLPGSLGALAIEAARFKREGGMTAEESTARAMSLFPHHVAGAKALIKDLRRNDPGNIPDPELAQGKPDYVLHLRATQLMQSTELNYREAVASVLDNDPALKVAYARS